MTNNNIIQDTVATLLMMNISQQNPQANRSHVKHALICLNWYKFSSKVQSGWRMCLCCNETIYIPKAYADDHILLSVGGVSGIFYRVTSLLVKALLRRFIFNICMSSGTLLSAGSTST